MVIAVCKRMILRCIIYNANVRRLASVDCLFAGAHEWMDDAEKSSWKDPITSRRRQRPQCSIRGRLISQSILDSVAIDFD